ncbi:MAG: hypothetical protein ACLS48_11945 [[Eubacterium] siraeum]
MAYRWFLGYLLNEQTPTLDNQLQFQNRFIAETIEKVFY